MNKLVKKSKTENGEIMFQNFDYLSLFDEQFSIDDFDKAVQTEKAESNSILSRGRHAVKSAYMDNEESYHYEVSMTDEMKKAIESGELELVTGKDGLMYAQLRGEKGKFGKPLPIEKQLEENGITADQLQMAIQMDTIRSQLDVMIERLKTIESQVTEVIQGQHNDRIGLYYSGLSLYAEANCIFDEALKTQLFSQSLKALSDANAQVIQEIRTCIEFLMTEQYKGSKDGINQIAERLSSIQKCYDVVYRSTLLKAAIYQQKNEMMAMLTTIDEYGRFIQKMIVPYVGALSELDRSVKLIDKGVWSEIANTLSMSGEMRKRLLSQEPLMLNMKEE